VLNSLKMRQVVFVEFLVQNVVETQKNAIFCVLLCFLRFDCVLNKELNENNLTHF